MWHLHESIELLDLIKGVDAWRETTVQAEDIVLDDGRERQVIEQRGELLPDFRISILAEALIIEAVHLSDLF